MDVTVTQRDVDEAFRLSPQRGTLHFFHNPIALAYAREMVVDYCATTIEKIHVASPSGVEYIQSLLPQAQNELVGWMKFRTMRLGPLHVF